MKNSDLGFYSVSSEELKGLVIACAMLEWLGLVDADLNMNKGLYQHEFRCQKLAGQCRSLLVKTSVEGNEQT